MHAAFSPRRKMLLHGTVWPAWSREGVHPWVVSDYLKRGPWEVCKEAWGLARDQEYWCVLQDDFIPCHGFTALVETFIQRHPNQPLCIFQPASVEPSEVKALMGKDDFVIPEHMIPWGGSLILPTKIIPQVIAMADVFTGFGTQDDTRLAHALLHLGLSTVNIGTSLIRHIGAGQTVVQDWEEPIEYRRGFTFHDGDP